MALPNVFSREVADKLIHRINTLSPATQPQWGKMSAPQVLAHCNVTYEMIYEDKHPKPNFLLRLIFKLFVKKIVVGEKPYPKSSQTAPAFIITTHKDFEIEKNRLIDFINKTQSLGEDNFDNKMSHSFGVLNKTEWNNMLYKHLEHHLTQFGV